MPQLLKEHVVKAASLKLAFLVCTIFHAAAFASDSTRYAPEHLAEAERLVYAMGAAESIIIPSMRYLANLRATDPQKAEAMAAAMEPFLVKEYVGQGLRHFFASQFDVETCRQLAEFWEGPVGRRFVDTQLQLLSTGSAPELRLTQEEQELMQQFEGTAAARAMAQAMPAFEQRLAAFANETQQLIARRLAEQDAR